jgi:pyridinium-3,5-bisthiocarboxylic acid mononucleotide nickel chelatase
MSLTCYLDAFSGLAGDMLTGALAAAGADQAAIAEAVHSLTCGAQVSFEAVKRGGIGALKYHVACQETAKHRHLPHIVKMIEQGSLTPRAKASAIAVFQRLGEAEAFIHQVPVEKVHFHEVGAADSIADIVGACVALDGLGVDSLVCSAVNVGSGTVTAEHGLMPVPAPATAKLLEGVPMYSRGPAFELTTPTGAALAVTLAARFGPLPAMTIRASGYGAGSHDFTEQPNVLRVLLGEPTGASEALAVTVIEANIDDLNPQVLAYATERLLEAGALDAALTPLLMKKGRPGSLLQVIAKPEDADRLAQIIFAETSTLGLRLHTAERRVAARSFESVTVRGAEVRIKVTSGGSFAPEYEDCRKLAIQSGAPLKDIIAEASFAYLSRIR